MTAGSVRNQGSSLRAPSAKARGQRSARISARLSALTFSSGVAIIVVICVISLIGRWAYSGPNTIHLGSTLQAPSWAHPLGTDYVGRDVLSRTLAATWVDLGVAISATFVSVLIGVVLGTMAGYFRGWVERIIMRIVDMVIAFPFMVIVLFIITIIGPGLTGVFVGLISGGWAVYARLARGEMLSLSEKSFIMAARTLGFSNRRVIARHAVPNLIRPCLVYSMSDIVLNILFVASLSYLGLGVRPPMSEWGSIIASGQAYILSAWWITTLPGCFLVVVGIGFSLIGDGLADRLRERRVILR